MLSKTQTFKLDMTTILFLLHAATYIHIYVRGGFNPSKSPIIKIWMFSDSIWNKLFCKLESQSESRIHVAYLAFALDPSVESSSI